MSKQEEIRGMLYRELISQAPTEEWYGKVDRILSRLHSQGVVIKKTDNLKSLDETEFSAVEPLIIEET